MINADQQQDRDFILEYYNELYDYERDVAREDYSDDDYD